MNKLEEPNRTHRPKKKYFAPKLVHYGKVTELTAGASGTASEGSMADARRP